MSKTRMTYKKGFIIYKSKIFWLVLMALLIFMADSLIKQGVKKKTPEYSSDSNRNPSQLNAATTFNSPPSQTSATANLNPTKNEEPVPYLNLDPDQEEEKLSQRALGLKPSEKKKLKENALDTALPQDLRFESIFLLSKSPTATKELEQVLLTPIPNSLKERFLDFENVLRAQAIEGIQNSPDKMSSQKIIDKILARTDNIFLLERLKTAKAYLKNDGNSLEVQDKKHLEKILGN